MARHCDGITVAGKPCATRIQNAPLHIPSFCQRHSADAPHYVICFGKLQTGDRCNAQIKWQEPWFRFCEDHSAQLKTLTRAIDALPNDMIDEIVGYLTPIDRLALASVNRALHRLVRNASPLSIPGQELSELHVVLTGEI